MALLNIGTTTTTVLKGLQVNGAMNITDVAAFNAYCKSQPSTGTYQMIEPTAFGLSGLLYLPGKRGVVQCNPGDYIAVDPTTGWPIVISKFASSGGGYVHS
jgi:hypothetical protein